MKIKKDIYIKGISLLEAIVSTAIIGIGFVAVLQMTNYSVQSIHTSGERTKANFLTNMIAEDVISNRSTGATIENFSEFVKTKLNSESNDLSQICSAGGAKSNNSGNIYGAYTQTSALAAFGQKKVASEMKLNKWKAILNSKDYMACKGTNETRKFQIFKVAPSWSALGEEENNSIKDEVMYIGKIQIKLNDGNKVKYLYFQSDYKLVGLKKIEQEDDGNDDPLIGTQQDEQDGQDPLLPPIQPPPNE